jgi:penicillin-binding protein 1C
MRRRKVIIISTILLALATWWLCCLPSPFFNTTYSTVLLDKDGQLLGARIASDGQWRFPADGFEVPETFAQSIIHFEDKRFYQHNGIDIIAMGRAMRDNIAQGKVVSGGSTLTMQTMRLARGNQKRNIWSKLIEACWSTRSELKYSKDEIMQLYAAHAPFGGNVVGLGAASWRYYHKTPDQLSWGEAAALAVLPNAPGMIHPGRNRDAFLQKRNRLIEVLRIKGIIDETEASLALDEPLPAEPHPLPNAAPHLLSQFAGSGKTIHSTIDMAMQERAQELLQRHADILSMNGVHNAALLVMENETGEVRAYIGNASNASKAHQNDVDIIRSERSSGSILKPFLYCAALEDGLITPKALLDDVPTYIRGYQPLNFSKEYMGMVPADEALSMSLNVPMVRMLQQYDILAFKEKLIKAGITTLHYSPEHYGLPLILGGAEVTLWDVCGAYASMARILDHAYVYDHRYDKSDVHQPVVVNEQMSERANEQMSERANERRKDGSPDHRITRSLDETGVWNVAAIYQTFEAMKTLRRPDQEGQWETYAGSKQIAWKTGTSFGFRDAWAVGVTPKYTIGVWVGNADGEGRPGVIGLHAAAPILFDVLRLLNPADEWWDPPYDAMRPMMTCTESGWLAGSQCTLTDTTYIVKGEQIPKVCNHHQSTYADASREYRYDPTCMPVDAMLTNYFTVPTLAESYYKRFHPEYELMPPMHPSCGGSDQRKDIALIYPRHGSKIYVPYEWDKQKSKAVFSAVHRSDTSPIYWHLDKTFIGKTTEFHQIEVDPQPGVHTLTLQDESGSVVVTQFEVLTK